MEGLRGGGLGLAEERVHGRLVGRRKMGRLLRRLLQRFGSGCSDRGADVKREARKGALECSQRRL